MISSEVLLNDTPVTLVFTVTLHVAVFSPSFVFAVITAVPFALAVTTPFLSTVAKLSLLELHETRLFSAFDGAMVGIRVAVEPTSSVSAVSFREIPVTRAPV